MLSRLFSAFLLTATALLLNGCFTQMVIRTFPIQREKFDTPDAVYVKPDGTMIIEATAKYDGEDSPFFKSFSRKRYLVRNPSKKSIVVEEPIDWQYNEYVKKYRTTVGVLQDPSKRPGSWRVIPNSFFKRDATPADLKGLLNESTRYSPEAVPYAVNGVVRSVDFTQVLSIREQSRVANTVIRRTLLPFVFVTDVVLAPVEYVAYMAALRHAHSHSKKKKIETLSVPSSRPLPLQ